MAGKTNITGGPRRPSPLPSLGVPGEGEGHRTGRARRSLSPSPGTPGEGRGEGPHASREFASPRMGPQETSMRIPTWLFVVLVVLLLGLALACLAPAVRGHLAALPYFIVTELLFFAWSGGTPTKRRRRDQA